MPDRIRGKRERPTSNDPIETAPAKILGHNLLVAPGQSR
jgi:hypothetical protein